MVLHPCLRSSNTQASPGPILHHSSVLRGDASTRTGCRYLADAAQTIGTVNSPVKRAGVKEQGGALCEVRIDALRARGLVGENPEYWGCGCQHRREIAGPTPVDWSSAS